MGISQNDIDELFYDGIEGHAEYPSEKVWNKVEAELDRRDADLHNQKYNAVKRYASLLSVLLLGILLYKIASMDRHQRDNIPGADKKQHQPNAAVINAEKTSKDSKTGLSNNPAAERKSKDAWDLPVIANNRSEESSKPGNVSPIILSSGELTGKEHPDAMTGYLALQKQADRLTDLPGPVSSPVSASDITNETSGINRKGNLLLFDITSIDDSRIKEITSTLSPAVPGPIQLPLISKSKKSYRDYSSSRFSLAFHASPGIGWNSLKETKSHLSSRAGGGNGGGSNGAGGNGNGSGGNNGVGSSGRGESRHDYMKSELNGLVYYGGLNLNYRLTKNLFAETGLTYLSSSTIVRSKKVYAVRDNTGSVSYRLNSSSGYSYLNPISTTNPAAGDSTVISESKNTLSYLGIPVAIGYKIFSSRRFSITAMTGVQLNIRLKGTTTADFGRDYRLSANTHGLQTIYLSSLANITGEMAINKRFSLTLAPTGLFGLSYINRGSSIRTRPNSLSLSAGLKMKL